MNESLLTHETITVEILGPDGKRKDKTRKNTIRYFKNGIEVSETGLNEMVCTLKTKQGDTDDCG